MPQFDMAIDELRAYSPALSVPGDFDEFWAATLAEARAHDLGATFEPVVTGLTLIDTFDVTYRGFGGQPVKAWLHLPADRTGPLSAVVKYQGYGGGRGLAYEDVLFAVAGHAYLIMDTRGQGSSWSVGHTPDADTGGEPAHPGSMTRGILDPTTYYYRRAFTDAVRAVEAMRCHPMVDATRVSVVGGSQGGGIALAVAGLVPDLATVVSDVPFLCDFPRATTIADTDPYAEIVRYLKVHRDRVDDAFRTLSYFDAANLATRAHVPALFSVALMDRICPPSTVYAAYNRYAGDKRIVEYPFNDHEGGGSFHGQVTLQWLAERLRADRP